MRTPIPLRTLLTPLVRVAPIVVALGAFAGPLPPTAPPALAQAPRTITLEAPAPGGTVASPVEVRGRVTVSPFENNLVGRVLDGAGRVVGEGPVTVTPDNPNVLGGPGTFSARLAFSAPAGPGRVEVADLSAQDGAVLTSASTGVLLAADPPPPTAAATWLDAAPPGPAWNVAGAPLPAPPPLQGNVDPLCAATERPATAPEDERVTGAGWRLFREYQSGWGLRVVFALSTYDGMCRPRDFQAFVFQSGAFAGTLAPQPMDARTDGALQGVLWLPPPASSASGTGSAPRLLATFSRYAAADALCCPSRTTTVTFELRQSGQVTGTGTATIVPVEADSADTTAAPAPGSAVTGTLTYRERIALPPDAVVTVTLLDVSRADAPAVTIATQTSSPAGQVPIPFSLAYDPAAISPQARYVVRGTITAGDPGAPGSGGQLLFTSTEAYPVLTQGAPSQVEVVLQRA